MNVNKWYLASAFLVLFSGIAQAVTPNFPGATEFSTTGVRCKAAADTQLKALGVTGEWAQLRSREMDGSKSFYTPTSIVGVWVEAQLFLNKEVQFRRITAKFAETFTLDLASCRWKTATQRQRRLFDVAGQAGESFDDHDLRDLLRAHKSGIIYVWSPNMPLSYRSVLNRPSGIENIKAVATELGLELTVLADPATNRLQVNQTIQRNSVFQTEVANLAARSANSLELSLRGMRTHFPVLIVYKDGKLSRHSYPGVGTRDEYRAFVTGQLNGGIR